MANNQQLLLGEGAGGGPANYIEDVFSTYLYTGNGSTQTITNNIDLSTKGGLVWIKQRNAVNNHALFDTSRGTNKLLYSNTTSAQVDSVVSYSDNTLTAFNANGFTLGNDSNLQVVNTSPNTYASWTFREQPKFFDIVTYTGDGTNNRAIAHNLGSAPGMIIVKNVTAAQSWVVYHRSTGTGNFTILNSTGAVSANADAFPSVSSTTFVPTANEAAFSLNTNATTFVAYLFAHDAGGFGLAGTDNVISCGSFTTDGSGYATVNLGYEPQWILYKRSSAGGVSWAIVDSMRGLTTYYGTDNQLFANTSAAEVNNSEIGPTATGFTTQPPTGQALFASSTYIYIAIRRGPMKVPTVGTSVYNVSTTANGTLMPSMAFPDAVLNYNLASPAGWQIADRLRGFLLGFPTNTSGAVTSNRYLATNSTAAESTSNCRIGGLGVARSGGVVGSNIPQEPGVIANGDFDTAYWFKRAPGFFDVVCYTGTGSANYSVAHNLAKVPEIVIIKERDRAVSGWRVPLPFLGSMAADLNRTDAAYDAGGAYFGNGSGYVAPTSTQMTLGSNTNVNNSGTTYVAYLFATCAGVSKVGSYTGNGSSQTIACGFAAGSRFVMIKRTDSTGDWYVWDSARGIVAGNDPHLSLNTTAAEVTTDDSVDTDNSGFIVNQDAATNVNVSSATYIFLAIA